MRVARSISTTCAVTLAVTAGVGARSYRALATRSLELERQNAALVDGYDELRGGYIECLVREEDRLLTETSEGFDADPQATTGDRRRGRGGASTDRRSAVVSAGTRVGKGAVTAGSAHTPGGVLPSRVARP